MDPNIPTKGFFTNVRYMFDLRDVVVDVQGGHRGRGERRREGTQQHSTACVSTFPDLVEPVLLGMTVPQ
jgi:hypothetical protein